MSGKIPGTEYDAEFKQLLHHFNLCVNSIVNFEGIDSFFKKYQLEHCQTAKTRVVSQKGGYAGEETQANLALRVMDVTQKIINASDLLQMEYYDVDQILPAIIEV